MHRLARFVLLALTIASPALAQRDIGTVEIQADNRTIPVRVSGATSELNALALQAFGAHGRYHLVASGFLWDIRFSPAGPSQVRVDITRGIGGGAAESEVVSGIGTRGAFFAAADVAVSKTNGLGLRGFFSSRLVFVAEKTGSKEIYTSDLFFGDVKQ